MTRTVRFSAIAAALALLASSAQAQTNYQWRGPNANAWFSPSNWLNGVNGTYPGTSAAPNPGTATDIAQFTNSFATTAVTVDMGFAGGSLQLAAIDARSAGATLTINNSSATTGTIRLNGGTVGGVGNTLVAVGIGNVGGNVTINNGTAAMGVVLGITNGVFNVYGDAAPPLSLVQGVRTLRIDSIISQATAGSGFTVQGGGILDLRGANTFSGDITITGSQLRVNSAGALGTNVGKTIVQSGGSLFFNPLKRIPKRSISPERASAKRACSSGQFAAVRTSTSTAC